MKKRRPNESLNYGITVGDLVYFDSEHSEFGAKNQRIEVEALAYLQKDDERMNGISRMIIGTVLLLLGVGVYFGINAYMLNMYQLSVKASHLIGLLSSGMFYFLCLVTVILTKSLPRLYESHGASDEDDTTEKDNN